MLRVFFQKSSAVVLQKVIYRSKKSIGAMVDTKLNPLKNISLLRKNTKTRSDKRSGRKREDVTTDEKDSSSNPKKIETDDDLLANSVSTHDQKIPLKDLEPQDDLTFTEHQASQHMKMV